MALNRAVEINHGRGLPGTPLLGHRLSAAAKASCIASSARSKSPSKRISVARIRPESTRYRESSNSRICSGDRSDMTTTLANPVLRSGGRRPGSQRQESLVMMNIRSRRESLPSEAREEVRAAGAKNAESAQLRGRARNRASRGAVPPKGQSATAFVATVMVEAAGVEPASGSAAGKATPCSASS